MDKDIDFIIKRFNSPNRVRHYKKAIKEIGLWRSEKEIFREYLQTKDKILDLGCGAGRVTFGLYDLGYERIIGVDLARNLIQKAEEYAKKNDYRIKFVVNSGLTLPFDTDSFDVIIFSFNGLMTIPKKENRDYVMKECARTLRNSGLFIFTTHDREAGEKFSEFWEEEEKRFQKGEQSRDIFDFGDIRFSERNKDPFIHVPSVAEVKESLAETGFELIQTEMRSKITQESEKVKDFSSDCRFWVARVVGSEE